MLLSPLVCTQNCATNDPNSRTYASVSAAWRMGGERIITGVRLTIVIRGMLCMFCIGLFVWLSKPVAQPALPRTCCCAASAAPITMNALTRLSLLWCLHCGGSMAYASQQDAPELLASSAAANDQDLLRHTVSQLLPRVQAGGAQAEQALAKLLFIASRPNAKVVMRSAGVAASASRLMKSPSSSSRLQRLAGSIITILTGMPVTSQISDERSGSYGRVHIVMPRPSRNPQRS